MTCSVPSTPGLRPSLFPSSPSPEIFHRCLHSLKMWLTVLTSSWALCDSSAHSEDPQTLSSSRPSCHGAFLGVSDTPECITISQVTTTTTKSSQTRRIQSLTLRRGHSSLPEQASQEGCSSAPSHVTFYFLPLHLSPCYELNCVPFQNSNASESDCIWG